MNPNELVNTELELVLRRLIDPLRNTADWVLLMPVLFAFAVLYFVMFFRQEESIGDMLKRIFVPRIMVTVMTILWAVYLLFYIVVVGVFFVRGVFVVPENEAQAANFVQFVLIVLALPLVLYVLALGLVTGLIMCFRKPIYLVGVVLVSALSFIYFTPLFFLPLRSVPFFLPGHYWSWMLVLIPIELVALFYVLMMYVRDARTIHPLWAAFLALLRCGVYLVLGIVFLLPGIQTYNTRETHSKVLVLFDVSGSMKLVDDVMKPGQKGIDHSRLAQIIGLQNKEYDLGENKQKTFLQHVLLKSPVTAYRFGGVLDDHEVQQLTDEFKWKKDRWQNWLHPDAANLKIPKKIGDKVLDANEREDLKLKLLALYDNLKNGTNVGGAALSAALRESGHLIQSIIIFSDGQSNLGSADSFSELRARSKNKQRPIHIITVGVGKYRQPVSIRLGDIRHPQQARPDDAFKIQVPVYGDGLPEKDFMVHLDISRVQKIKEKWVPVGGVVKTLSKPGRFKPGEHPYATVEFDVNVRKVMGLSPKDASEDDKLEGYWQFVARVPVLPEEVTVVKVHKSKPARVLVQKRKLRVLLFASGPSREYQFIRTMLFREVQEKRVDMSVLLQQTAQDDNVDQDVPKDRLLSHFPTKLGKAQKHGDSLGHFDVIIAFDPDWDVLDKTQLDMLKRWVGDPAYAGGFIFVAGPINTFRLATPGGHDVSSIQSILPVKFKDNRLLAAGIGHDSTRPYLLNFSDNAAQFGFLNLKEDEMDYKKGWEEFFWDGESAPPGKVAVPYNGFYNYYPVDRIKAGSKVLATFAGPPNSRINDGRDEMPYIVVMEYGAGKTSFIGSGELWRLRQYNEEFHQRLWIKMCRYVGSGTLNRTSNYGQILMVSKAATGQISLEALVLGEDMNPLPPDARPMVHVAFPKTFDKNLDKDTLAKFRLEAKAKGDEHKGWFSGKFKVYTPGSYTLKINIPGTNEQLDHTISIFKPDLEMGNPRPDHGHLYDLASAAGPLLKRLDDEKRQAFLRILQPPSRQDDKDAKPDQNGDKEQIRLYFPLEQAHTIPDLLIEVKPHKQSIKGAYRDLWDQGWGGDSVSLYWPLLILPAAVGLLLTVILLFGRQWISTVIVFGLTAFFAMGVLAAGFVIPPGEWYQVSLQTSLFWILMIVPAAICLLVVAILLTMQRWISGAIMILVTLLLPALVFALGVLANTLPLPGLQEFLASQLPLQMSHVLAVVVGLLALEWLCRKLLRLA